jgi:2-methylcitrate dehydratase PrpD
MGQQIEMLARFAAETQLDDIPVPVREHAKRVLLDTLGVILGGSARPEVVALRNRLAANNSTGATVYAPGAPVHDARTAALLNGIAAPVHDARTAALLNGIAGRAIELCEGLRLVSGQAAIQILPGVLAVGEQSKASGKTLLAALVLGYEVAARLGFAFTPRALAHQNGQAMMLAAAARARACVGLMPNR